MASGLSLAEPGGRPPWQSDADQEAFFLFLAGSLEEDGELITPVDLEAVPAQEEGFANDGQDVSSNKDLSHNTKGEGL